MKHLLVLNPNTRQALTGHLVDLARHQVQQAHEARPEGARARGAPPQVLGATAPFGADYIASEATYVVAAHAVLDAWQQHVLAHGRPRAVLVACFGDPGVWALRETAGVPVMGLAEAAMREAQDLGPFGVVTGGAAWGPMLERLARGLQLAGPQRLRWVRTVSTSGGDMVAQPEQAWRSLGQACAEGLAQDAQQVACGAVTRPVGSVILGGAALAGWADRLDPPPTVPIIDSLAAGVRWLLAQS